MKDKTALIAAFAELDYDENPEEMLMVVNVLRATEKAWLEKTSAQYHEMVWGDEKKALKRNEMEEMDE
jgi:hypothetical protein